MNLDNLNNTELKKLIFIQTGGKRVEGTTEELKEFFKGKIPKESKFVESRKKLQIFLDKNASSFATNMPCYGKVNAGKCTIYNCSDIIHINCYKGAEEYMEDKCKP
jgi:hypothetical protein